MAIKQHWAQWRPDSVRFNDINTTDGFVADTGGKKLVLHTLLLSGRIGNIAGKTTLLLSAGPTDGNRATIPFGTVVVDNLGSFSHDFGGIELPTDYGLWARVKSTTVATAPRIDGLLSADQVTP